MLPVLAASLLNLAIYYGYPSLADDANGDVARAAAVFAPYDVVVFGDGLELDPSAAADAGLREERRRLPAIVRAIHGAGPTKIYGYIALGSTQHLDEDEIERRIAAWQRAGADGIFFDEAGRDFGVTPERRDAAACRAHARRLPVIMNAFNPDDLFVPAPARACSELGPDDAILVESFSVRNGEEQPGAAAKRQADAALKWRTRYGVRVFAVTTSDGRPFSAAAFASARDRAQRFQLDGFGWGEPGFSVDSRLPRRH